jgi:hypothetical protein
MVLDYSAQPVVAFIAHPAGYPALLCLLAGMGAETDSLYAPGGCDFIGCVFAG